MEIYQIYQWYRPTPMEIYQIQWKSTKNLPMEIYQIYQIWPGNLQHIYHTTYFKQNLSLSLISLPLPLPAEIYKVVNTTVLPVN